MLPSADTARGQDGVSSAVARLRVRPLLTRVFFPALTVVLGIQALRVFLPGLVWVLGDNMGWSEPLVGIIALLVFLTAFLAGGLRRLLGDRLMIVATAGGLGVLRLLMQIWSGEAVLAVSLAMAGTALFVLFVPAYVWKAQIAGSAGTGRFALGLLVGLVLDTAIHGAFYTYDISWQPGSLPLLVTSLLVLVQWILLAAVTLFSNADVAEGVAGPAEKNASVNPLALMAVGPILFLQVVVLQNVARAATLSDWPLPTAFGWTLLAQIAGLGAGAWLLSKPRRRLWLLALLSGVGLVAILAKSYPEGAAVNTILLVLGQVLLSLLVVLVFVAIGAKPLKRTFCAITVAHGIGMILMLLFLVGYYLVYYFRLPYSNTMLEPIAAFVVASCALGSSAALHQRTGSSDRAWLVAVLVLPLLVLPLVGVLTWQAPTAVSGNGFPVRLMTYNLHNGFNAEGYLAMDDIAKEVEKWDPDIVALQEVSRGWVINGRLDMLSWLSQRLDMPYVFGPTADPLWGNAILSRYPIVEHAHYDLPPRDLPVLRGFSVAVVDLGNGDRIQVIAAHFHHVEGDTDIRVLQSQQVVDFWGGDSSTVLLGDLNADPDAPEMAMLRQAGLVDVVASIEPPPVFTWPSASPERRIDYIWVSSDLTVNDIRVPMSRASDHLPVVAEIDRNVSNRSYQE